MERRLELQVVILTGSRATHSPLIAGTGLNSKAMLPVGGRPMLASVLHAAAGSRHVSEIYVSSDDPQVLDLVCGVPFKTLPSEPNAVQSLVKSLERLPGRNWVLFISGDHPLLTTEMIDYFVEEAVTRELTFAVAMVERRLVRRDYPNSQRTYFRVKGGAYSGGNMFLVNKPEFGGSIAFMEAIDRNRKKPWKNLAMSDPITIVRFLLRQLTIHDIARKAAGVFKCNVGVVEMPFAECCMDVDKPSDREIAEVLLRKRRAAQGGEESPPCPEITASAG